MLSLKLQAEVTEDRKLIVQLPETVQAGRHEVVLVIDEAIIPTPLEANLMQLAGKVTSFAEIEDPVAWQGQQREEWTREWDNS